MLSAYLLNPTFILPNRPQALPALALALMLGACGLAAVSVPAAAQTSVAAPASAPRPGVSPKSIPVPAGSSATSSALRWSALSSAQQQSLRPLSGTWNTLSDGRKQKWLAIAQNYASLVPAEQEKLHSRMAQWAALKPADRERARINFAETKKLSPPDRASNWETYQALSPEERQRLAGRAKTKPTGAATAIKPVPREKLASVPVTRHTPPSIREQALAKQPIDRKTLLPLAPRPAPAASRPEN